MIGSKYIQVECSALSENLVSAKTELKQCLQKQLALQDETEQAHRESGHIKMFVACVLYISVIYSNVVFTIGNLKKKDQSTRQI